MSGPVVEVDFSGTAFGGSPTWTDITAYVQEVSGSWGRQDWFSDVSPSQFTVTLNNSDGRFTPGRVASPYYPYVRYGARVRYRETLSSAGSVGSPTSLFSSQLASSEAAQTSPTFTAVSGNLIVITQELFTPSSAGATSFAITDTIGLAWSQVASTKGTSGNFSAAVMFYAFGNGASGTVTVTPSLTGAASTGMALSGFSMSNAAGIGATGTSTTGTVTLSSAPASTSLVLSLLVSGLGSDPANTIPAGHTSLFTDRKSGVDTYGTLSYDNGAASQSMTFGGTATNAAAVAVEVLAGSSVYMADGYVTDWDTEPSADQPWTASVNVTDIFGRMASGTELRGFLTEEMLLDSPLCMYPLQEAEGSQSFGDITGSQPAASITTSKYGAGVVDAGQAASGSFVAGTVVQLTNPASTQQASQGSWLTFPVPTLTSSAYSFVAWVQMPALNTGNPHTIAQATSNVNSTTAGIDLYYTTSGLFAQVSDSAGVAASVTANVTAPFDGNMHHFAVTVGADLKTVTLYIDGKSAGSAVAGSAMGAPVAAGSVMNLGMSMYGSTAPPSEAFTGGYAFVAFYNSTLSPARVLAHYNAGANAFSGERTDTHAARILAYRPNLGSNLDTGAGNVGTGDIGGQTQQQALLDTGDAEGGVIYADGQGRLVLRARSRLFNPAPVVTLNYALGQVGLGTTYVDSIENSRNDVTVTRINGADQRVYNQTHINTYGEFTDSRTLNVDTDQAALNMAGWLVAQGTLEQLAIPSLTCDLLAMTKNGYSGVVSSVLVLAPMDLVQLTNLESKAPASSMNLMIQGGSFTRTSDEWSVQFNTSRAPVAVSIWDGSSWDANPPVWAF